MAQTKKKEEIKKAKKRNSMVVLNDLPIEAAPETTSIWKEEVEGLLDRNFESVLEVIDAIAGRVCKRLGQEDDSNLHEFIVMMLDTDEEIRQELAEVFDVKK
jgi:hypothetical protein